MPERRLSQGIAPVPDRLGGHFHGHQERDETRLTLPGGRVLTLSPDD